MNRYDDVDRTLARWFDAESAPAGTADVLDRALRATSRRRPRPRLIAAVGSHWIGDFVGSNPGARTLGQRRSGMRTSMALLLLLLALVVVGAAILVGSRLLQPAPGIGRLGHLAFAMDDGLYVADWDGRNPKRIVSSSQLPDDVPAGCRSFFGGPVWSPDGRHLAFRTEWSDLCSGFIVVSDAGGSSLTAVPASGWLINWSPDSSRIVTWVDLWKSIGIYGIDGERQALLEPPRSVIPSGDHDPSWTPGGTAAMLWNGVVVPIDGAAPYSDPKLRYPFQSSVSPDGTRIAYPTFPDFGSIVVAATSDRASQRVVGSVAPSVIAKLLWSPTGDRIAFEVDGSAPGIVDVATGVTTSLGLHDAGYSLIAFSPEGDRILLATSASIWSAQADGTGARELVGGGVTGGDWQWLPSGS
jgi:WD40 repeat protein